MIQSWRWAGPCIALAAMALTGAAQARNRPREVAPEPPSAFRTSSDLVLINASVMDRAGRPVNGLDATQFHVLEGGVEQKIVSFNQGDMPVSIVLVVDTSRSMRRLTGRSAEAVSSLLKTSNPEDEYAVVEFADRPSLAADWTRDTSQVTDRLMHAEAHGSTALLDAVVFAGKVARRAANERRILIVISDGIDNHSRRSIAGVKRYLLEANVQVYAIDTVNEENLWATPWDADGPALLETICQAGGGRRIEVERYTNLPQAVDDVAREIRNQYILGYQPASLRSPGKYHHVELRVSHPPGFEQISVSWRHGYYEPRN
ncbi:MAG TPA: VWA domain-containing protein [Bryobacteraceae bacterium]|nr:VWA domain-containing protein [Bryobacteraceae bacterium]